MRSASMTGVSSSCRLMSLLSCLLRCLTPITCHPPVIDRCGVAAEQLKFRVVLPVAPPKGLTGVKAVACSGTFGASLLPIVGCMGDHDYIQVVRWTHTLAHTMKCSMCYYGHSERWRGAAAA
jgi:hypothetical protein